MTDRIVLDRSTQILRIELPADRGWRWDGEARGAVDPVLTPRIPDDVAFVSAAVLAEKAKQFDDGLYACVERSAQAGPPLLATALRRRRESINTSGRTCQ